MCLCVRAGLVSNEGRPARSEAGWGLFGFDGQTCVREKAEIKWEKRRKEVGTEDDEKEE